MEGLNDELRYIELSLDSADGTNPYSYDFSVLNWPNFFFTRPIYNIAGMKIISAEIPFTYYTINAENNTFTFRENLIELPITAVVPPGNYTPSQFADILTTVMSTYGDSDDYEVTYNDGPTKNFTIKKTTSNVPFYITFPNDDGNTSLRLQLGLPAGTTTSVTNGTNQLITTVYPPQLTGPNYVYLCSRTLGSLTNLYLPAGSTDGVGGPEIAKIPVTVNPYDVVYYTDPDPTKYFDLDKLPQLTNLDLYFTLGNTSEKPIDFNGSSFSIKMGLLIRRDIQSHSFKNSSRKLFS